MIRVKQLISAFSAILLAGLVGLGSPVVASTPDGETPANEGVCDELIGATPGLYGLCNAYCEAQDLDTLDKGPPNTKILKNYRKKMKAGDPDMPCISTPCACWDDPSVINVINATELCNTTQPGIIQLRQDALHLADADINPGSERCRFFNFTPGIGGVLMSHDLTDPNDPTNNPASAQTCFNDIVARCNELGL